MKDKQKKIRKKIEKLELWLNRPQANILAVHDLNSAIKRKIERLKEKLTLG